MPGAVGGDQPYHTMEGAQAETGMDPKQVEVLAELRAVQFTVDKM